ncbi:unnamed protein product [Somion occarium]|uniref:F-box/LRR-repeat protein n=1 Tax=Somion occarium TaxID=3059160 RepID=A0ABP1EC53_9APHY
MTSVIPRRMISGMMQTCRDLYQVGIRHLATKANDLVFFTTPEQIASFCLFMHGNVEYRSSFLRRLSIEFNIYKDWSKSSEDFKLFATILRHATRLECLGFWNLEDFLIDVPEMVTAIASLTSITSMDIESQDTYTSDNAYRMVQKMQSPVTNLTLGEISSENYSPLPFIEAFQNSLRELSIHDASDICMELWSSNIVVPRLDLLVLHGLWPHNADIESLILAFPNISRLYAYTLTDDETDEDRAFQRSANLDAQKSVSWPSLEILCGDVTTLWTLGLTCRVRCLKFWESVYCEDLPLFKDIIQCCKPNWLYVILKGREEDSPEGPNRPVLTLPPVDRIQGMIAHDLLQLDLRIYLNGNFTVKSFNLLLDQIRDLGSLTSLRILGLSIYVHCAGSELIAFH